MSLPVALHLADRRCVVVGGGRIATRKVRSLLESGATNVVVVAPECADDLVALQRDGRITIAARPFADSDLDGAWLVITATDHPEVARAVADAAAQRRIWCNAAELPEVSTWTGAAAIRRGDVTVSVTTEGQSPAFTAWLRDQLEALIGPEYGTMCALLAEERSEMQAQGAATESLDWRRALDNGVLDLVRNGQMDDAREMLRSCR